MWLVNTGWSGGAFGVGERMSLKYTRAIIDAIHDGTLRDGGFETDPIFGFEVPTACPGVDAKVLWPRNTWNDLNAYDATAKKLAHLFRQNFRQYESGVGDTVLAAGPRI